MLYAFMRAKVITIFQNNKHIEKKNPQTTKYLRIFLI